LSQDAIADVLALPGEKVPTLTPVLACHDRSLKVLRQSSVIFSVELNSAPTALQLFYNDGGEKGDEVLFGTSDGKVCY
jgi:Bardet-Biedl syndrome 7 protein